MRTAWTAAAACALAALVACDDSSPIIGALSPSATRAGSAMFTLAVTGRSFARTSVVRWNGAVRPTSFQDRQHLTASIAAEDVASPGMAQVAVFTPGAGASKAIDFAIGPADRAPVARAGPDQTASVGAEVHLDGSGSTDADGDLLTYRWTFAERPDGSLAELSDATALAPAFLVDRPGTYAMDLVVDDGQISSDPSRVRVSTVNSAPVARAGADQRAKVGDTVYLDGTGSTDVDGDPLSFRWSFASRPAASQSTLSNSGAARTPFRLDAPGNYVLELIVEDGKAASAPSRVTVTTENTAPVADAGGPRGATVGAPVQLDGSASSDVDGDSLTYRWSFLATPEGSSGTLSAPAAVRPTFTPDRPGIYVIQLVVNDGALESAPTTVQVTTGLPVPTADAGKGQSIRVGTLVQLDGSASSGPGGSALTYRWSFTLRPAGSSAALSDAASAKPTFVPDRRGDYGLQLVVNNGLADSSPSTVLVTTENSAPVANPGAAQSAPVGATVTLDSRASSDIDGDPLTFRWSFASRPAASAAALSDPAAAAPTFTLDLPGTYVLQLIVSDGSLDSAPKTTTVTSRNSAPVARASAGGPIYVAQTARLDGSASSDADDDALSYRWSFTSVPAGSGVALSNAATSSPTFVPDRPGTYALQLVVSDGALDSAPASLSLTPSNTVPVAVARPLSSFAHLGQSLALDGTGSSDVDGDSLTYLWTVTSRPIGSAAALSAATTARPSLTPDVAGAYAIQLVVNDGKASSAPVSVSATGTNTAPTARIAFTSAQVGGQASLDGRSSSDPEGDAWSYRWSLVSRPTGSAAALSSASASTPTFPIDRAGIYQVQLVVNDGWADSAAASANVVSVNTPPVARATASTTWNFGSTIQLDGSTSSDLDGNSLTYAWTLTRPAGSSAALSSATAVNPTFRLDNLGTFTAQLVVSDGVASSAPISLDITTWQCRSCVDCNAQACIDHQCGECMIDSDCCAPLVCAFGTCTSY